MRYEVHGGVAMAEKKPKKVDMDALSPKEKLKYEIAQELGLMDRVENLGWKSLTAKETGRIGGLVTRRLKEQTEHDTK